ncbi:hypothetical protein SynPROS91_02195 [Synechococcus sp. PROS-9-1]|nr:hypothetical protein SynPROS91_02195 [Synechococcus sp. PROS-9-1]
MRTRTQTGMKKQQPNDHSLSELFPLEPILLELFGLEDT